MRTFTSSCDCSIGRVVGVGLLSIMWPVPAGAQAAPTPPEAAFAESFDQGNGGWTVVGDAQNESAEPTHHASGGNPGGYIEARDDEAGGVWKWNAPASFCTALQSSWQGRGDRMLVLKYDLRQSAITDPFKANDVILTGGGHQLGFVAALAPDVKWTAFHVPLAAELWRNIGTQQVATEPELAAVMGALTSLTIRGEYRTGADTGGLDNVGWGWQPGPPKPLAPELRFVRFANGRYEPVAELRHGDEFYVEATYAVKPSQPPGKAELSWTDGQPREVEFATTEDDKLFRSPRMKLESLPP